MSMASPPLPDGTGDIHRRAAAALRSLVGLLTGRYRTHRITCFGWRFSREIRECCSVTGTDQAAFHFFILMETKECYGEAAIQDFVNHHFRAGKVLVLAHHMGRVRDLVKDRHRFYTQVRSAGVLLYAEDEETAPVSPVSPDDWQETAGEQFRTHFGLALGFFHGATVQLEKNQLRICLFLLHQTMEQACIALIRVFLGYRSDFHNLGRLLDLCSCFIRDPGDLFPRTTEKDRRLFQLLSKCYTEARYREDFPVHEADCRDILDAVGGFIKKTEDLCRERLPALRECVWTV